MLKFTYEVTNMSLEKVKTYFRQFDMDSRIIELAESSATVELAAQALHCAPERIAKTLSFRLGERILLIIVAGDAKIDNRKYREHFGAKARMIDASEVEHLVGHAVGGVCPFAINEGVEVYLDRSLQRFTTVFPACGDAHSAIE